jgi:sugar lactone lactonase YvrE
LLIAAVAVAGVTVVPAAYADTVLEVVAGTGTAGSPGDGGPSSAAHLDHPTGVAVAPDRTVYISDAGNRTVRAVSPAGTITTVAGTGRAGAGAGTVPEGAIATRVDLGLPASLAVGPDRTVYIADAGLFLVLALSPDGRLSVLAGNGRRGDTGDGGPATKAALGSPRGLAAAPDGTVYIADPDNQRVRAVSRGGTIAMVADPG